MPLLKLFHLPGMFHFCHYLCKLLFLYQYPRFPLNVSSQWLTTLFKYNLSLHCALNFALCCTTFTFCHFTSVMQTPWRHELIKFNFVTETEHISDKCLSSEWRLLDKLRVCNGPLKNMSVLPGWEKWEKHSKQRDHGYTWGIPHLFKWQATCHLIKHICGSSNLILWVELTYRTPWIHMLY